MSSIVSYTSSPTPSTALSSDPPPNTSKTPDIQFIVLSAIMVVIGVILICLRHVYESRRENATPLVPVIGMLATGPRISQASTLNQMQSVDVGTSY